jgi:sigma-B regulation protein RsbU (phosphoserine phosphatase)
LNVDLQVPDWLPQMEAVLETLNEGVMIRDDCNQIIFVNERFVEMTGLSAAEVLGRTPTHFYSGEDHEFLKEKIEQSEITGSSSFEFYLPRKDGGRVPVLISGRVIEDPDGRIFAVVTFANITEQKRVEAQLREANEHLEERQREIEIELTLAARVQQSLTPQGLRWGNVAVEAFYLPVRTIGGDFGLVKTVGEHQLNLNVCDVSGHGISSALLANRIYTETISLLERGTEPGEMLRKLNHFSLRNLGASGFFFTMAAARLNSDGRRLTFAGGGHPPVMVVRAGGKICQLKSLALILGTLEEAVIGKVSEEVELARGDRVVLYSDGLTDVFNERGEILGVDGLEEVVRGASRVPLLEMKQGILAGVERWRSGPASDDTSLLIAEML